MKMDIEWHENCLINSKSSAGRLQITIARQQHQLNKLAQKNDLYQAQIDLAKKENKTEFDSERYAIKRLCV